MGRQDGDEDDEEGEDEDEDEDEDEGEDYRLTRVLDRYDVAAAPEGEALRQMLENATGPENKSTWVREMG
jgi:hypothetical protein